MSDEVLFNVMLMRNYTGWRKKLSAALPKLFVVYKNLYHAVFKMGIHSLHIHLKKGLQKTGRYDLKPC